MIPTQIINLIDLKEFSHPSFTYKIDFTNKRITRNIDDAEAILQAVKKILYTERYSYVIYSSLYGVELENYIGKDYDFIKSDLKRSISEALLVDDRILSISDFTISDIDNNSLTATFIVNSVDGRISINTGVIMI